MSSIDVGVSGVRLPKVFEGWCGVPAVPWGLGSPGATAGLEGDDGSGGGGREAFGLRPNDEFTSLEEGGCVSLFWFSVACLGGKSSLLLSVGGRISSSKSSNRFDGVVVGDGGVI